MADPVAEKSSFLRMYMTSHPDTLVAYAKWYGKLTEAVTGAEMTSIDSKSMTLTCKLKAGGTKVVVVEFDPPLAGYEEVKPRLLEMKAFAQEGLGMIKAPQISTFEFPRKALKTIPFVLPVLYFGLAPHNSTSPIFGPAHAVQAALGPSLLKYGTYGIIFAHFLESLYTLSLCRRHRTPLGPT
ncbi:hypothetical protein AX16_004326, partial [Volvariella volvacea WC 439]